MYLRLKVSKTTIGVCDIKVHKHATQKVSEKYHKQTDKQTNKLSMHYTKIMIINCNHPFCIVIRL